MVATKAISNNNNKAKKPGRKKKAQRELFLIRVTFLAMWLSFSGIIFVIAAFSDINWMRPSLEQFIGQSVHRSVKLGRLSWHFGWHGLSVHTSRLLVAGRAGDPFLMASNCEIGFSIWPLLIGIGRIEYVDMQKPLFMAIRTGPKTWNFDDLLVTSPDIDFIQIQSGHIFVVDREGMEKSQRFPDTELNDVQIKLQRAGNFIPAQVNISFGLSRQPNSAKYSFTGSAWGQESKPWWEKKCHFDLTSKHFTVENWQTIASLITVDNKNLSYPNIISRLASVITKSISSSPNAPQIFIPTSGQFDLHANGDGVPSQNLKTDLQFGVDNLVVNARNKTTINIPATSLTAQIELKPDSLKWDKTTIRVPEYKMLLNSAGQTRTTSNGNEETYQWSLVGLLGDLKKLNPLTAFICGNLIGNTTNNKRFGNLVGKLFFDLSLNNVNENTQYKAEVRAADINIDGIMPLLLSINRLTNNKAGFNNNPFEGKYLQELDLSKQAKFSGTIIGKSEQGLTLKDCYFKDEQMVWKVSGQINQDGTWNELVIANKDLELAELSNKVNREARFGRQMKTVLGLSPVCRLDLAGKAQVTAKLTSLAGSGESNGNKEKELNSIACETVFEDASLKISELHLDIRHLNGSYTTGQNKLSCKDIRFGIASGVVDINANMPAHRNEPLYFHLHAKDIDVMDLRAVLQLFHVETKYLDTWHLSDKLADIDILIRGSVGVPLVAVVASPADLAFTVPNGKQSIHATGGKIVYANNVFEAQNVNLSTQNSKCVISLVIKNPAGSSKLEKLSLLINSGDVSDLQAYSSSGANIWSALTKKYQITNAKGSIAGSVEYVYLKDKQKLNSVLDFNGINFKCGSQKWLCRNLKGRVTFADTDLALHDITGSIGDTSFVMQGRLINYKEANGADKSALWQGEVSAQVAPDQLNDLTSLCSPPGQKSSLSLQAKRPIFLKIRSHSHNNHSSQSFVISADPEAALSITTNNFTFHQPARKLIINGLYHIDDQKLTWRSLNFDFGGSSINIQGSVSNFGNNKDKRKAEPFYDLQILTSDYVPASCIGQIFSNGVINGALSGQLKAALSIQGPVRAWSTSGKIFLADLSVPDLYLNHIIGTISLQPAQSTAASPAIPALLQFDKLNLGQIQLSQASGNLTWQGDNNSLKGAHNEVSQVYLKNFIARIAQGQLVAEGQADLANNKSHLDLSVKEANLTQLWSQVTSSSIQAAGLLNCHFKIDTSGGTAKEFEQNMTGSGQIHVGQGSFSRLAQLHARMNQVNLLHQGIFGFNLNNVMQSVLPTKASEFTSIDSAFALDKEVLTIKHILYDGKDIKFSAAGKANLASHSLDLDVAGVMPRVSNSVLGGKLGELSREITLQKLLDGVTMHKLEKLPSLPLIGGMGGGPEIFTCRIIAPYDQPKMISQSIQKSFRWLHNH